MMKIKIHYLILIIPIIIFSGCYDHPEACFSVDKDQLSPNKEVQFYNCSQNADEVVWDFGDGTRSTEWSPLKSYSQGGKYRVELTTYNRDGKEQDSYIETITVGERYVSRVEVIKASFTDSLGNQWDADGSGPDIRFFMKKMNSGLLFFGPATTDIQPSDLPLVWHSFYTNSGTADIKISNEEWMFDLLDMTSGGAEDIMARWYLNPINSPNPTILTKPGYEVRVYWEIK